MYKVHLCEREMHHNQGQLVWRYLQVHRSHVRAGGSWRAMSTQILLLRAHLLAEATSSMNIC